MNHQIIERKKKYQNSRQEQIQKEKRIERVRSLVFLLFIINILIFYNTKISIFKFLFFTLILLFFLLVFIHNNTKKEKERIRHYLEIIEKYEKRIPQALENFRRAGKEEAITLLAGDASAILKELKGPYDFVFMDAAKGQYIHFLPDILRMMPRGGMLVSDNVLKGGEIMESRYAVVRRDRTIHSRMREYLYELKHNEQLETAILPVGDGVTVSVRKYTDGR